MSKAYSRNVKVQSSPVSSSASNEQTFGTSPQKFSKEQSFNDKLSLIVRLMNDSDVFRNQFIAEIFENKPIIYSNAPILMSELKQIKDEFGISSLLPINLHDECEIRIGLVKSR